MKYPLFLSDFDGTLAGRDGTVSRANIEAIAEYRKRGGIFAVVTGRMIGSILPRLKELGISEGLVVAYQGGTILEISTGRLLRSEGFPPEAACRAIRFLEEDQRHVHAYADDVLYVNRNDDLLKMYEKICGVRGTVVEGSLSAFIARLNRPVQKVLAMVSPAQREELLGKLSAALGKGFTVTTSADFLVEILPEGVSKAAAVDFLSEYYNIPRERVAAIGDQRNDLPMIERAGGGFAVADADGEVRRAARVVASCGENGVKEALEIAMGE